MFQDNMISMRADGKFDCTICGSVLAQLKIAKRHLKMMHLDPQWFQCTLCGSVIQNRMNFSNHIRRMHQMKGGITLYGRPVKPNE
jgi:ribosomal protein S27E